MGENEGNDGARLSPELFHALELGGKELLELRRQVDHASIVVLRGPRIQAQRASAEIELAPLEREHLALGPPAEGIGNRDRDPEILGQMPAYRLKLLALEETLPRCGLL